ncbi:MAG: MerR family transcriptional regulator [Oligoflexia bacterium]|nr:MerR family transcriptional regulator [Oligoflexia bacterium]
MDLDQTLVPENPESPEASNKNEPMEFIVEDVPNPELQAMPVFGMDPVPEPIEEVPLELNDIGNHVDPQESSIDLTAITRQIPDKMAFKIGEVAELAGLKPYVLRYWESEFDALNPQKSAFNQRMYTRKDVETVLIIKKLLYDEKFSIAGAKRKIRELRKELKVEKQNQDVKERLHSASERVEQLLEDIRRVKELFG